MRPRYHHGDLRQALIDAALEELDGRGELPSLRALARACAVSQTAPYRHFDSFEALQAAVAAAAFERLTAAIGAAGGTLSEPVARLAAGLRAYVEFGCRHPSWYELMFGRNLALLKRPEVGAAGRAAYATLIDAIGACGVEAPQAVAFTVWSALHGMTDLAGSGLTPPDAAPDIASAAVDGLVVMCVDYVQGALSPPRGRGAQAASRLKPARRTSS